MTICVKTKIMTKEGKGAYWVCHGTLSGNGGVIKRFPFRESNRIYQLSRAKSFAKRCAQATHEMGSMF